ncbi:STAS domain-containing protein [Micromonospora mirobrigensis]|uniref:STAS domain-containing protein n=1 Tax=Micromonospora mirobrigensis TaxID=262898 RepID=UPI001C408A4D|nr:STAS domain-containing protein [Micromonospora mirobrigensis]
MTALRRWYSPTGLHPGDHVCWTFADPALHGEVDHDLVDDVFPALVDLTGGSPGEVVLDLTDLEFLDAAGARMLARAVRLLAQTGVRLRLIRPRRTVSHCLELFDLLDAQGAAA